MRKALLVGINNYPKCPLTGCENDAVRLSSVLQKHHDGSPNFDCRTCLSSKQTVTRGRLRGLIGDLLAKPADTALFYFSGHGSEEKSTGILVTQDYAENDLGIPMGELIELASEASSRIREVFIVLDCCHSGYAGKTWIAPNNDILPKGISILTASSPHEAAIERGGEGVFTALVCDALEGGAADVLGKVIRRLGSMQLGAEASGGESAEAMVSQAAEDFLAVLSTQMDKPPEERGWAAFDELAEIAGNFDLIVDVNVPDARTLPLAEAGRRFGTLLSRQQPTGGMAGQVNHTLVSQFRMPGYPFVLVSTDLLQEGEDLHTFCSSVHHYGIAWTPSSMEQRIGRIDRVRSQTDRRLSSLQQELRHEDKLQVYFPHLQDTVEVVQVRRVLTRMNTFLRLMHEGLILPGGDERKINLTREMVEERCLASPIDKPLRSAFRVQEEHLRGERRSLAASQNAAELATQRFAKLASAPVPGLEVSWERSANSGQLFGTAILGKRQQPFTLLLRSFSGRILVRCISPVGRVALPEEGATIRATVEKLRARVGAIATEQDRTYNLTVEEDVVLADDVATDGARVGWLIRHVTTAADMLEQNHLPGKDEPIATFKTDLERESYAD